MKRWLLGVAALLIVGQAVALIMLWEERGAFAARGDAGKAAAARLVRERQQNDELYATVQQLRQKVEHYERIVDPSVTSWRDFEDLLEATDSKRVQLANAVRRFVAWLSTSQRLTLQGRTAEDLGMTAAQWHAFQEAIAAPASDG